MDDGTHVQGSEMGARHVGGFGRFTLRIKMTRFGWIKSKEISMGSRNKVCEADAYLIFVGEEGTTV